MDLAISVAPSLVPLSRDFPESAHFARARIEGFSFAEEEGIHGGRHPEPRVRRLQAPTARSAVPIRWGIWSLFLLLFWAWDVRLLEVVIVISMVGRCVPWVGGHGWRGGRLTARVHLPVLFRGLRYRGTVLPHR